MENSLLAIFDNIHCTIVQGLWPNYGATSIPKKSNFNHNQLKCISKSKGNKNKFSPSGSKST